MFEEELFDIPLEGQVCRGEFLGLGQELQAMLLKKSVVDCRQEQILLDYWRMASEELHCQLEPLLFVLDRCRDRAYEERLITLNCLVLSRLLRATVLLLLCKFNLGGNFFELENLITPRSTGLR